MTISDDKQRFVVVIEKDLLEKFKNLAKKEDRSASNLMVTLIRNYVEKKQS